MLVLPQIVQLLVKCSKLFARLIDYEDQTLDGFRNDYHNLIGNTIYLEMMKYPSLLDGDCSVIGELNKAFLLVNKFFDNDPIFISKVTSIYASKCVDNSDVSKEALFRGLALDPFAISICIVKVSYFSSVYDPKLAAEVPLQRDARVNQLRWLLTTFADSMSLSDALKCLELSVKLSDVFLLCKSMLVIQKQLVQSHDIHLLLELSLMSTNALFESCGYLDFTAKEVHEVIEIFIIAWFEQLHFAYLKVTLLPLDISDDLAISEEENVYQIIQRLVFIFFECYKHAKYQQTPNASTILEKVHALAVLILQNPKKAWYWFLCYLGSLDTITMPYRMGLDESTKNDVVLDQVCTLAEINSLNLNIRIDNKLLVVTPRVFGDSERHRQHSVRWEVLQSICQHFADFQIELDGIEPEVVTFPNTEQNVINNLSVFQFRRDGEKWVRREVVWSSCV
jgi:hypothetical protein